MKVLFSPVGDRDPIANYRDGAMLHIVRHYQPDVIYLYLSQLMIERHKKDDRFRETIRWLGEDLNKEFDVRIIERPNLTKVHEFDYFFDDFSDIIEKIHQEVPGVSKIYLNVSSGTPAMKMTLSILATLGGDLYEQVQVSAPLSESSIPHSDQERSFEGRDTYDVDDDNSPESENRCFTPKGNYLLYQIQKRILFSHLDNFNYVAARDIVGQMQSSGLDPKVVHLVNAAVSRTRLDREAMNKDLKRANGFFPLPDKNVVRDGETFEALLLLQLKVEQKRYDDFFRFITPVFFHILLYRLKSKYKITRRNIAEGYCWKRWEDSPNIDPHYASKAAAFIFSLDLDGKKTYPYVDSKTLLDLLKELGEDNDIYSQFKELRNIEIKVRNKAAHTIQAVTEAWIQMEVGEKPSEIFNRLKKLTESIGLVESRSQWGSYKKMNAYIKERINEVKVRG